MTAPGAGGINLSEWALRHRPFIFFLMILCAVAGVWAYLELGRSEDPPFTVKIMLVKAVWPGATVNETINLVTDKIEKKLEDVRALSFLRSETKAGETTIYVHLKGSVLPRQVPDIWYQVRKRVFDVWRTLPPGVLGPFFDDDFGDTFGIIYALTSDGFSQRDMRDEAEKIRARLLRVPEVSKVELIGAQDEQIHIEFSTAAVANLGVDRNEIIRAIQSPNAVAPSGVVTTANERIYIRLSGAYRSEADLRQINLHTRSGFLRLGDVATIARAYEDPPKRLFRFKGEPAIGIAVSMTEDGDILRLGKAVRQEVAGIQADLPIGLDLHSVADQAMVVTTAIHGFTKALFEAVVIVMAVGFLALGVRAGLVVAIAIPLVLGITFAIMWYAGIALQRVSLGALIISLGLLVDDAMITVEMMISKLEERMDRIKAASFAYTSTAFPMLTGTLVTVAGFIPVGFARSDAGEYSGSLFWVITIALLASWFVAVLFSPVVGVYLLPKEIPKKEHAEGRIVRLFRKSLLFSLHHRRAVIGATVALFVVSLFGAKFLKQQFFPASDRLELVLSVSLPQSASIYTTQKAAEQIEDLLRADADIAYWSFYVGSSPIRFYLPLQPGPPNEFSTHAVIMTRNAGVRDAVRSRLAKAVSENFPSAVARVAPLELGPPVGWPIKYRVSGEDPQRVRMLAFEMAKLVSTDPHVRNVNFDWNEPIKTVRVEVDQDKAKQVGLPSDELARALAAVMTGLEITQVRDSIYLVSVIGRSQHTERVDLSTLRNLQIQMPTGRSVPLGDIATLEYADEQPLIVREKRLPTITVQAELVGAESASVVAGLAPKVKQLQATLPARYSIEVGGIVEESARAEASIHAVVPAMLIIMLTILMLQLHSFQRLFLVISVAPLGLIGVVFVMLATGTPMGFIATLGVIALVGIIIRNSVILIDQIEVNIGQGENPWDAVVNATMHRVRPILLTAAAAMLGMVPIAFDVFWGPMAYAMVGGLATATLLTLVFLPALYAVWFKIPEPPAALAR
jgi:multidrug efflux pump